MRPNDARALMALTRAIAALDTERYGVFFAMNTETDRLSVAVWRQDQADMPVMSCMGFRCSETDMLALERKVKEIDGTWEQDRIELGGMRPL